jgi:ATP phosphoribosyltransferase regulatory subunit
MFGSIESLEQSKIKIKNKRVQNAILNLEKINQVLVSCNKDKYISYDLGMLSKYNYYTGIIFEAYTYGVGDAIAKGGRYNSLLQHFGKDSPAIGFVITVEDILKALNRKQIAYEAVSDSILLLHDNDSYLKSLTLATKLRDMGINVQISAIQFMEEFLLNSDKLSDLMESRQISDLFILKGNEILKMNSNTLEQKTYEFNDIIGVYNERK